MSRGRQQTIKVTKKKCKKVKFLIHKTSHQGQDETQEKKKKKKRRKRKMFKMIWMSSDSCHSLLVMLNKTVFQTSEMEVRQLFEGREEHNDETGPDVICMTNYTLKNAHVLSMLCFSIA